MFDSVSKREEQWIVVEGGCPAIMSKETFDAVQKKMQDQIECSSTNLNRNHYMLKGLVRCASCGEIMTPQTAQSTGDSQTQKQKSLQRTGEDQL